MEKKILISIIIPVYNAEKYLNCCIDSILAQTFTDFELLLINDGSKDKSGAICDGYAKKDNRVRVFHKENGGVSSARNMGLDNARGERISFVDADDWLESDFLAILFGDTSMADLTYFGCQYCYDDNSVTSYIPAEFYSQDRNDIEKCLGHLKDNKQNFEYLGYTWNKLFKMSIVKEHSISFIEGLMVREDELFTLSYACHITSLRVKHNVLYNYRILDNGLTHKFKPKEEYILLIGQLTTVLCQYRDPELIFSENNSILMCYFRALTVDRLFTKSWILLFRQFLIKGRYLKKRQKIRGKKMNMIFRFQNLPFQIIAAFIANIIYRRSWNNS